MEQSPVHRALGKKMQSEVVKMVLQFVEGFAPRGVDKGIWRSILANWNNAYGDHGLNPIDVRVEIESWNLLLGPLVWHVRRGNPARGPWTDRLCAKPPLDQRLVDAGLPVYLRRDTRINEMRGHCRILEVNKAGTAFEHSNPGWGRDEALWCKLADVFDMVVEVDYIRLRDTSD